MIVCPTCRKEMRVEKMGVAVRWRGTHAYFGDLWECPKCHKQVVHCNTIPCHNDKMKKDDVYMDDYYEEHFVKSNAVNLRR